MHATIERKTLRAPFDGVLGIRLVNLGQHLAAGEAVVPLQSLNPIYVNFGVPQQDIAQIRVGHRVQITARDVAGVEFSGRVTALDSIVDKATRNVQVQATLANTTAAAARHVRPDRADARRQPLGHRAARIGHQLRPRDSVFVVTELKGNGVSYRGVRQQFVKLGGGRGDQIAIVSGVSAGEEIVTSGVFKLRNGAAVVVNNKVQPSNKSKPKPEDS